MCTGGGRRRRSCIGTNCLMSGISALLAWFSRDWKELAFSMWDGALDEFPFVVG